MYALVLLASTNSNGNIIFSQIWRTNFWQIYTKTFYTQTDEKRDSVFSSPFMSIDQKWLSFSSSTGQTMYTTQQPSFKIHKTNAIPYENDDT